MLRHRLVVVAGPRHPLARSAHVALGALAAADWLVDASGADPATEVGVLLDRLRVPERRVRVFPSLGAAWAPPPEGEGVAPGVAHLVADDVERGRLVVLPVDGTPVDLMWHVNTVRGAAPGADRRQAVPLPRHPRRPAGHAPRRRQRARLAVPAAGPRHAVELTAPATNASRLRHRAVNER